MIKYICEQESTEWDMNIPFKELIDYNNDCIINRDWKKSKHDNCYDGCCIYVKHPENDCYETMIGLADDGFVYIGDGSINDGELVSIEEGLMELFMNREYIKLLRENNKILGEGI